MTIKVFCYGSNMCRQRLDARVAVQRWLGTAFLPEFELRWHKRGKDQSGKADAYHTGRSVDRVWGAIAELRKADRATLDRFEGLGAGYTLREVEVRWAGPGESAAASETVETVPCVVYTAMDPWIEPGLRPFDWYHAYVLHGARQHRLPADYVAGLRQQPVVTDPDPRRAHWNRKVLQKLA